MSPPHQALLAIGAASVLLLWASLHLRRKDRLLHDLPTSKVHGVFIGLVELKGTAEAEIPLTGHLSGRHCVSFSYSVEEHWTHTVTETSTDKDGKTRSRTRTESGWTTVDSGGESTDFYLRDDTGVVLVRPKGAKIEPIVVFEKTATLGDPLYYAKGPTGAVSNSNHTRRFVEHAIPLHETLYIVGHARERADVVAPEIAANKHAPMYLISTRTEEKVARGYAGWSWTWWTIGLLTAGIAGFIAQKPPRPDLIAGAAAAFVAAWALCWTWMVYNSLVSLRERVRQGWSLIDVQLKRRHDLIPLINTAVETLRVHESDVQKLVAALRAQQQATPPGQSGPDPDGVSPSVQVVIEKYPRLVANDGFLKLHRELVSTEQRIALARTYYNDIATHFATRLERIPDRFVARIGSMKPFGLLEAENFQRAAVHVNLAT